MDLTVNLDRDTLSLIKDAFIRRGILRDVNGDGDTFKQITLDVFVNVAMEQLNSVNDDDLCNTNTSNVTSDDKVKDTKMIKMLVHIFDCVDVDSKGFIVFDDFVSYCLQAGKNIFLPTVKNSGIEYTQTTKCSSHLHGRKLYYSPTISMLFVFEAESAQLSYFRTCGDLSGKINIIKEFLKHQRLNTSVSVTYHSKKAEKTTASENLLSKKNFTSRGSLLCMTAIPPFSFAFSTSNSFIVFCNYDLTSKNFLVVGHCECPDKQVGMIYVSQSNLLLTWPGDASDHCFRFWDVQTHQLKYIVQRNKDTILAVCEVKFNPTGYIVSSSIDRKLTLWSLNPLSGDNDIFDLRGHKHALTSLVFAKTHELIIGAGFDFEFYAWDLVTKELQMKFHGHIYSVIRLHLIEVPNERVVSLDEWGYLKVWNLDRDQGMKAAVLQSLLLDYNRKVRIVDFVPCFRRGLDLAFLVDKVNFCRLDDHSQNCPISGGLGYCERYGKLHMITDSLLTCCRLRDGNILKRFALLSDHHVDVNKFSNANLDLSKFDISYDKLTCATVDRVGKKLFLATSEGHILLFNALSLHLLKVLALNEKSNMHGSIVTLHYVEKDRLLVVAYGGGGVRIINGCHHVDQVPSERHESICNDLYKPYVQNTPPSKPECLRECEYDFIHDQVLGMAVSDAFRLIAIVSVHGIVRVFDYFTLKVLTIFSIPRSNDVEVECTSINFIPNAPVIVVSDTVGRVTMFAVSLLKNDFVVTFTPLYLFYESLKDGTADIVVPAIRSVECMCWVEDPIVRAVCLVEQDLKTKWKKRSATSGVERNCFCWKIVVGDDEGSIFLVDITAILERLGVHLNDSKAPTFSYSPYVNNNNKLVSLVDATDRTQVASFELLVKRPIGVDVDPKARSSLLRYIKGDKKWKGHKSRCVQIKAVSDNRLFWEKNNRDFDLVCDLDRFPIQPKQVLSSSDAGDVKLWNLDGSLLGGLTEVVDDDEQKERDRETSKDSSIFSAERKDSQSLKWKLTALESSDVSLIVQRKYLSFAKTLARVKKLDTSGIITSIEEWQQYVDSNTSDRNGYHHEPFLESLVAWLQGAIKPTTFQQLALDEAFVKTRLFGSSVSHMSLDLAEGSTSSDINAYYKWKETLVPSDKAGLGSVRLMNADMTRRPEDTLKEHILGSEQSDHHGPRPGSVYYQNYQMEEQRKSQNYAKERLRNTKVNLSDYLRPERAAALAKNETRKLTRARPSTAPNKRRAAERVSLVDRFHLMQDDKQLASSLQSPVASEADIARESRHKKMEEILEALTIEKPTTTMSFFSPLKTEYAMKTADDRATEENKTDPFLTLADRLHRTTLKVSALEDEAKVAPVTREKKHLKHRVHKAMQDAHNGIIDVMKVEQEKLKMSTNKVVTVTSHNIRGRYGPYKWSDLISVLNLFCSLSSKQWFSEADELHKVTSAWDDDYILNFDEIMHRPDVRDNQFLRSAFTSIKEFGTTEDCVYLRDIIKLFFPLAFDVEQTRIFCFIVAMDAFYTFLKCTAPPPGQTAKKAVDNSKGIVSTLVPDKVKGFRGWHIQHQYFNELKSTFKRLYEQESGTVTVCDVLDVLFLTTKVSKDCKPLQYLRTRIKQDWGVSLDNEVNSELITKIVEGGLKIKIRYPSKLLDPIMAEAVAVYDNLIESAVGHSPIPISEETTRFLMKS